MVIIMNNGFSMLNILNGLSRTLNFANQMIPIYKQLKPIIANSGKVFSTLKSLNINNLTSNKIPKPLSPPPPISSSPNYISTSSPTFFQ